MKQALSDYSERQRALNLAESFIIQAPAGSGKTELLIQRFLALLSTVNEPEEIVAMTFTRKAASEMRARIIQALENAELDKTPDSDHEKLTFKLAKAALKRAKARNWQLINTVSRLKIQTIDAFSANLSKQMPVLSGLGAQPETLEDASVLYEQAAINTLLELESNKQWSEAVADLLKHLDNDMARARRLIVNMLRKREQWLPYLVGIQSSKVNEREMLEKSMQATIKNGLQKLLQSYPEEFKHELLTLLRYAAKNMLELKPNSPLATLQDIEQIPEAEADNLGQWQAISSLFLTESLSWRKSLNKNIGFPAADGDADEKALRKEMKQRMTELIQALSQHKGLLENLAFVKQLPDSQYTEAQWHKINALSQVLIVAVAQLRVLFASNNQIDFSGVSQAALQALGTNDKPTDLALKLDYNIQHLLVDEFQDISLNQYQLLSALVRNWSIDDGHSLFLVGDPMQSIYRFREAEVGLFIDTFHKRHIEGVPLAALRLNVNFRSTQGLVNYFNSVFEQVFPEYDDVAKGAVSYSASTAANNSNKNTAVNIYPAYEHNRELEAEKLIEVIQNIRKDKDSQQDSIAILVRSRTHLQEIIPLLKENNLNFQAHDIDVLKDEAVIRDLTALTFAYLYPADRLSWFSILRAPWCGIELNDLQKLVKQDTNAIIFEQLNTKDLVKPLSASTKKKLSHISNIFSKAYKNKYRASLRDTILSIWYDLNGPACYKNNTDLNNAMTFFNLLSEHEQAGNIVDREAFIQSLNKLYATPFVAEEEHSPLQIMTIHKAKGLEFDHVLIPGLGYKPRAQQAELLLWRQLALENEQKGLLLAPIQQVGEDKSSIYHYLEYLEKESQSLEQQRLLYVAMTRAKKTLYLLGHCNNSIDKKTGEISLKPTANSHLETLWPLLESEYQQQYSPDSEHKDTNVLYIDNKNYRLPAGWQAPERKSMEGHNIHLTELDSSAAPIEYEWASETIRQIGIVVHALIERINNIETLKLLQLHSPETKDFFSIQLQQQGVQEKELNWATEIVTQAMSNMCEDERSHWIFNPTHKDAHNEYQLSGIFDNKINNIIIDRTFVDEKNERWIIDYKSSRHEEDDKEAFLDQQLERYRPQLEKYAAVMQGIENRTIKLGLYFPLLKGWREWEFIG